MRAKGDEPTVAAEAEALRIEGLEHSFGDLRVIDRIDLRLGAQEIVALVGPSGCGKSTLLEIGAGLEEQTAGRVHTAGGDTTAARLATCAYMPQHDLLLPWLRAIDNAALPLRLSGTGASAARSEAEPLFARLGLAGFERSRPFQLSGGMKQRIAFARTLLTGKPVLLLDEPFASLDAITRADLQGWLRAVLAEQQRAVLLVTHDVEEALFLADRVIVLSERPARAVWEGSLPAELRASGDRAHVVTSAGFAAVREQALHALGSGTGATA